MKLHRSDAPPSLFRRIAQNCYAQIIALDLLAIVALVIWLHFR